jgi:RNA recognition motif-containing protein
MKTEEMALEAINALDNYNFMGSQISVEVLNNKIPLKSMLKP